MSGRGKGCGGRGKFQGKSGFSGQTRPHLQRESKKLITDWTYYLGSTKQACEDEATTECCITFIKQNFEFGGDIATAIINQEPIATKIWKPSLQFSRNPDQELKNIENEQYKIEFKADYNNYHSRE